MDQIDALRAFNRLYTRELGFLGRSYLGSGLGVAEVRILYELAHGGVSTARELAGRLGLDEGYLSRTLKGFERRGWLRREPDANDARRRRLSLNDEGRRMMESLETASRDDVGARLERMRDEDRTLLLSGASAMRQALGDAVLSPDKITLDDLAPGDPGWVIARHGALYARDEGYDLRFEGLVAGIVAEFIRTRDPACERVWIARAGGERLGCIFCVRENDGVARLRMFLIEPRARGLGLGRRMLDECLEFAKAAGYRRMVLWTHESHRAACALYAKAGFRMTSSTPAEAFGQSVVDQTWERDL